MALKMRTSIKANDDTRSSVKSDYSTVDVDVEKGGGYRQAIKAPSEMTATTGMNTKESLQNMPMEMMGDELPPPEQIVTTNSHSNAYAHKWVFTSLIVILGVAASAVVMMIGMLSAQRETAAEFDHEASELAHAIDLSWQNYIMFALWIHESCHFSTNSLEDINNSSTISHEFGFCSRRKFKHLYEHIESMKKKFIAMQYIPNVTNELRPQLEEESRLFMQQHDPNFNYGGIRDYLAYPNGTFRGIVPSPTNRSWYFPIHYLEPVDRNEVALDLDMYSFRKDEIDKAMRTWQPVLGPRGKLLQEDSPDVYAVSLIHPGYPASYEGDLSRPSNAISKIVIRIPDLIHQAAENAAFGCSVVYIFDETKHRTEATNDGEPIFLAGADVRDVSAIDNNDGEHFNRTELKPEIRYKDIPHEKQMYTTTISAADHTWKIIIYPKRDSTYTSNPSFPFILLGGCIILVGCLILAFAFHHNIRRVAKMNKIKSDSEKEKAELALMQAKREMHLNDFIAHEVRNPLSSAIAALSFVSSTTQEQLDDDNETKRLLLEDIHIIDSSLQYINDLLRNMLDIHRTQNKKMKLDAVPTDILKDIFEPVVAILFMKENKAKIVTECPDNLIVTLDRLRVKQIVLNLSINSSKFVEDGFIKLRAQVVDGGNNVQLSIEDSGPGIPMEKRGRLFAKFQESFDLLSQGTGIGLHICKSLSDLMGADLYLDDNYHSGLVGRPGARFVVDLNTAPMSTSLMAADFINDPNVDANVDDMGGGKVQHDDIERTMKALGGTENGGCFLQEDLPKEPLSILFVDDDMILRKLFSRTLRRIAPHWQIEEASNGETAVKLAQSNTYHLIFIDQYMASIEKQLLGTETVRALRAKGVTSILCGLSANDLKQQFIDSGADAFMHKPFPCEKEKLSIEIKRVLHDGKVNDHGGL